MLLTRAGVLGIRSAIVAILVYSISAQAQSPTDLTNQIAATDRQLRSARDELTRDEKREDAIEQRLRDATAALRRAQEQKQPSGSIERLQRSIRDLQADLGQQRSEVRRSKAEVDTLEKRLSGLRHQHASAVLRAAAIPKAKPALQARVQPPPKLNLANSDPDLVRLFEARKVKTLEHPQLSLMKPEPEKPELRMRIAKVMKPGVAEAGRPSRPPAAAPSAVVLVRKPTLVVNAGSQLPVISGGIAAGANPAPQLGQPARLVYELRVSRPFYRLGFSTVGVLVSGDEPVCSGTLIHPGWILTAAHCVAYHDERGDLRVLTQSGKPLRFYLANGDSDGTYAVAPDGRPQLQMDKLRAIPFDWLYVPTTWKGEADSDVALLRVTEVDKQLRPGDFPWLITSEVVGLSEVTIAAYGHANSSAGASSGRLEVGWQEVEFGGTDIAVFMWDYVGDLEVTSSSCQVDSGGPVYIGIQQGYLDEKHELVGVISRFRKPLASPLEWRHADPCKGGEALNTRVDTGQIRAWMCTTTKNALNGCPRPQ